MKKLKFSFSALALVAGLTAAFAFNKPANHRFTENWQEVDSMGQLVIGGEFHQAADISGAQSAFGCFSSTTPCAGQVDQQDGNLLGPKIYKP